MNNLQALIDWFEHLSPATVDRVPDFYAANAEFKDPFNEVRGTEAIARIFRHMFTQVDAPRFVIGSRFGSEGEEGGRGGVMLLWDFHFRTRGRCAAPATCASTPPARSCCIATTGTRPRSCMPSCPCWAG